MSNRNVRSRAARLPSIVALAVTGAACAAAEPDAYGSFEATEIVVSSELPGRVVFYDAIEGSQVAAGAIVALVDTMSAALQLAELHAQRAAGTAQTGQAGAQVAALEVQLRAAQRERTRMQRLYDDEAATAQQLDAALSAVDVLHAQLRAAREQTAGTRDQTGAADARIALLRHQIDRSRIASPVTGTVLASYVNAGEYVQPGQPLFRVASLDTLVLRSYVTGAQLAHVHLGQEVEVHVMAGAYGERGLPGVVAWIAADAEFTPTPIQTRDERAELVYAVRIRVPNPDGLLRIGMPADVRFREQVRPGEERT